MFLLGFSLFMLSAIRTTLRSSVIDYLYLGVSRLHNLLLEFYLTRHFYLELTNIRAQGFLCNNPLDEINS